MQGDFAAALDAACRRLSLDLFSCEDSLDEVLHDRGVRVEEVGGGAIIAVNQGSAGLIHIVPHGGALAPEALGDLLGPEHVQALATAVVLNRDAGTTQLCHNLVRLALERRLGLTIAYFKTSRLFLDANRAYDTEQVPLSPYAGSSELYEEYMRTSGDRERQRLLLPWLARVNDLLAVANVAVHHHTFDNLSLAYRDHDKKPWQSRPQAQVFWQKPTLAADIGVPRGEFLPRAVVERLAATLRLGLGLDEVLVDDPLVAPIMPFLASQVPGQAPGPWHVVYELRKDLLTAAFYNVWAKTALTMAQMASEARSAQEEHKE